MRVGILFLDKRFDGVGARLHERQVDWHFCFLRHGSFDGEVGAGISELGGDSHESGNEGLRGTHCSHNRLGSYKHELYVVLSALNVPQMLLFTVATKRSFPSGQATDEIIVSKMKRKIGNNSYMHSRRGFNSPASIKSRRGSSPGTPSSTKLSDAE